MNTGQYPEIPSDRADDLHNLEIIDKAQPILFMAGNQFMVMDDLIQLFQERHPEVEPGEGLDQRDRVNYFITRLTNAPNPVNADKFLNFIKSPQAQEIYRQYGFVPHFI